MDDAVDKPKSIVPAWQKAPGQPEAETQTTNANSQPATLEQARMFLQDPEVQKETPERKAEFLASKGISQTDIQELLNAAGTATAKTGPQVSSTSEKREVPDVEPRSELTTTQIPEKKEDRPPIITYPEFLTKPVRPPPLVTVNGFLNTLYAFGGFSTLLYGTSKYVLEPMVQSLTEARISLHESAKEDLAKLVEKLETVVSEIPPTVKKGGLLVGAEQAARDDDGDEMSSYEDPTELFHRDIGVQTSLPSSPIPAPSEMAPPEPASVRQARRLTELVASVKAVSDGLVGQTENLSDVKSLLDVFRDELDQLSSAQTGSDYASGFSMYSSSSRNEPDDEIKKAKENIRRVKGVLLSTRSFPASTR